MRVKNYFGGGRNLTVTFKPYKNKITGKSDPMFAYDGKNNGSFVHASTLIEKRHVLILDDGTEVTVEKYCISKQSDN